MEVTKESVHISDVRVGDCIEHQGKLMTVGRKDLKTGFMGLMVFGDSYRLGRTPVIKATPIRVSSTRRPQYQNTEGR